MARPLQFLARHALWFLSSWVMFSAHWGFSFWRIFPTVRLRSGCPHALHSRSCVGVLFVLSCVCLLYTSSSFSPCVVFLRFSFMQLWVLCVLFRSFRSFLIMVIPVSAPCGWFPMMSRAFAILAILFAQCWSCSVICASFIFYRCHFSCHVFLVLIRGVFWLRAPQLIRVCVSACFNLSFWAQDVVVGCLISICRFAHCGFSFLDQWVSCISRAQ